MIRTGMGIFVFCIAVGAAEARTVNPTYERFDFSTWKLGVVLTPKLSVTDIDPHCHRGATDEREG